jgi:hypothetical protein
MHIDFSLFSEIEVKSTLPAHIGGKGMDKALPLQQFEQDFHGNKSEHTGNARARAKNCASSIHAQVKR